MKHKPYRDDPSPCCEAVRARSDRYDAYYCTECGAWLEEHCGDNECEFCQLRPDNALPPEIA